VEPVSRSHTGVTGINYVSAVGRYSIRGRRTERIGIDIGRLLPSDPPNDDMNRRWIPAVAVAAALFVAAVVPVAPGGGGGPVGVDKLMHAVGYVVLAAALTHPLDGHHRSVALAFVAAVAYGLFLESVQAPLAYRAFDLADAVANAVGAAIGVGGKAWRRARE
jgi:VanZ family protein